MASLDPEKRAIFAAEADLALEPSPEKPPKRRFLPWLLVLLGLLVLVSIGAASHRCSVATSLFTNHGVSPAGYASYARITGLRSQAINSRSPTPKAQDETTSTTSAEAPNRTVLKTFEVAQPVLLPGGPAESDGSTRDGKDYSPPLCTVLLMRHDFAWSYNAPFVGDYTPPSCAFNRVVLNFSVVSQGRQFDRLAIMYFGDTEVWRTSTAEPTTPPGISWIYLKDMTQYLYFWKSPQKLIFDLGNLIDDKYTGIFNTTLTAIFYNTDVVTEQAPPSDLIIPISSRHGANNSISRFSLPEENATNTISLPRNIRRAVFSVSANGQANEEFWWSNVLESDVDTFNATAGELPGLSPFREVQVLIDGQLAGVEWPFPVIFTGGVVPSLHRPIVGIHAFDLREHEIDISPFLPLLCDGKEHTFTIRVAGLKDTGSSTSATLTESVNESWYVTGKLFLWLDDDSSSITTGDAPTINLTPPYIAVTRSVTATSNGTNETLAYTTSVRRTLEISTLNLKTQHSSPFSLSPATWTQSLTYTNKGAVTAFGFTQVNDLHIAGNDAALALAAPGDDTINDNKPLGPLPFHTGHHYRTAYTYTLFSNSTYAVAPQGNLSISAFLRQSKDVSVAGASVFPSGLEAFASSSSAPLYSGSGSDITGLVPAGRVQTVKEGTAEFRQTGDGKQSTGWGDARQVLSFGVDGGKELYYRRVGAVNGTLVEDLRRVEGNVVEGGVEGAGAGAGAGGKGVADVGAMAYA